MLSICFLVLCVLGLSNPTFASKPKLIEMKKDFDLLENISFALHCYLLSGSKTVFFEWQKDGRKLFNSTKIKIDNSDSFSTLSLSDLHRSDSGVYRCNAKNAFGNDSITTIINIKGFSIFFKLNFI